MNKNSSPRYWLWLLLAFFLIVNLPSIKNMWTLHQHINDLQHQESMIKKQNQDLKIQVKNLKTDQEVEKIAREQLGLIKPGEHLLVPVVK